MKSTRGGVACTRPPLLESPESAEVRIERTMVEVLLLLVHLWKEHSQLGRSSV